MVTERVKEDVNQVESGTLPQWITDHVRDYLETGGKSGHYMDMTEFGGDGEQACLLMTTIGRKTGKSYIIPVIYGIAGSNYIVVGSLGGSDKHPSWVHNLMANPVIEVQVGSETFTARATLTTGTERERLWELLTEMYPPYKDYQARTTREFPVFSLSRIK